MKIKTIIFDLGGVLINVDYNKPIEAFKELGLPVDKGFYSKSGQSPLFDQLETGKISPDEFRNEIRKISGRELTNEAIDAAWNSILLDFPAQRMNLLHELKKKYRLFLLSNTNAIHIPEVYRILEYTFGKNDFPLVFEKCYYSHEMHMRKPHVAIFEQVLKNHNLAGNETFFIDDSPQHVKGAQQAGLQAHWLNIKEETVVDYFRKLSFI